MLMFKSPESVIMLLCGKVESRFKMELKLLLSWPWHREIILDYLEIDAISRVPRGRRGQRLRVIGRWRKSVRSWGRECGKPLEVGKGKKQIPFHPKASRKEGSPANTLAIPVRPMSDFWYTKLQDKINVHCSKPLIVWQLMVEANRKLIRYLHMFLN